jgi:hypothetical protein
MEWIFRKMEQKFEVREWREEDPLPRLSDGMVLLFNFWALGNDSD